MTPGPHNPLRERVLARAAACDDHRWVPVLARSLTRPTAIEPEVLPLFLVLCVLAGRRDGRVLVMREQLASLLDIDERTLTERLERVHEGRLVQLDVRGPYLVLHVRMWPGRNWKTAKTPFETEGSSPTEAEQSRTAEQAAAAGVNSQQNAALPRSNPSSAAAGHCGRGDAEVSLRDESWLEEFVDRLVEFLAAKDERANYRTFCSAYPPAVLEEAFRRVVETPPDRIRKSRAALFTFLVKSLHRERQP
jgi:hypothetical protein